MATVDELLRGAQLVRSPEAPARDGLHLEHMAAWGTLARAAARALDAAPQGRTDLDMRAIELLKGLEVSGAQAVSQPAVEAESGILGVALRLGAVADLVRGSAQRHDRSAPDPGEQRHLRARIYGTLYRTAAYTVPAIAPNRAGWQDLLQLAHLTQPFRDVRQLSGGHLEDLAAPSATRSDLENVTFRWERAATRALLDRPTRLVYETVAADLAVLSASVAVVGVALRGHLAGQDDRLERMTATAQRAYQAWTAASRWPDLMTYPGPRSAELDVASRQMRAAVQGALRQGPRWAPPEALLEANAPAALLDGVRRLGASSGRVAEDHSRTFAQLQQGQARLWAGPKPAPTARRGQQATGRWVELDARALRSAANLGGLVSVGNVALREVGEQATAITRATRRLTSWPTVADGSTPTIGLGRAPELAVNPGPPTSRTGGSVSI